MVFLLLCGRRPEVEMHEPNKNLWLHWERQEIEGLNGSKAKELKEREGQQVGEAQ